MRIRTGLAAALVFALAGVAIAAQPDSVSGSEPQAGRYTMQPTDGGFLRLDSATGDVSFCSRTGGELACKPVKDDRDLQAEVARLVAENKALKAEVKRLEDMVLADGGKPKHKLELPSEEDVDKALSYFERMIKKFRDKMKDLEGGTGKGTPL
ncbi:MAG: hypothetical protein AB7O57_10880 [Hyphomicrobiaceae bacterium]